MINEIDRLEKAIIFTTKLLSGQKDKSGNPAIEHPISVMVLVSSYSEKVVAILHDVMEDTDLTVEDIEKEVPLSEKEKEALVLLTHKKYEPYIDYIQKIKDSGNSIAFIVKGADVIRNKGRDRSFLPEKDQIRLLNKYNIALKILGISQ